LIHGGRVREAETAGQLNASHLRVVVLPHKMQRLATYYTV
jgi:hypothetical protein